MNSALGRHILVEFIGCSPEVLDDVAIIERGMCEAAQQAGATVIQSTFHHFSPFGVSGVVVIQESHLAIHTWPEYQYAAVDLFTCGDTVDPWLSFDHLKKVFKAQNQSALEMYRGSLSLLNRVKFKVSELRSETEKKVKPHFTRSLWFTDRDENQAFSLRYSGDTLFFEKSPFQNVRVMESHTYGKFLALNNMIMCTERDEFHYHEMIVHAPLQLLRQPKRVLVIGGGDGGTVRELFKYSSIEKVVMVEIDEVVVKASKLHLPSISCELENPKLELRIDDGIKYVSEMAVKQPGSFDAVIVDSTDPVGPAKGLFTEEFYANCSKLLKEKGVLVTQSESPMFHTATFVELNQCLKKVYGNDSVHTLLFFAPTYPSGMWSLQVAVRGDIHPIASLDSDRTRVFSREMKLRYYSEEVHRGAFAIPYFVKALLGEV